MDLVTALILLLVIGVIAWVLPIPGVVVVVAVVLVLIAAVTPYLRRA